MRGLFTNLLTQRLFLTLLSHHLFGIFQKKFKKMFVSCKYWFTGLIVNLNKYFKIYNKCTWKKHRRKISAHEKSRNCNNNISCWVSFESKPHFSGFKLPWVWLYGYIGSGRPRCFSGPIPCTRSFTGILQFRWLPIPNSMPIREAFRDYSQAVRRLHLVTWLPNVLPDSFLNCWADL